MRYYRAYIMGRDGHILRPVDLFCENDDAAKQQARRLVDGYDIELWQLDRKVSVFLSGPAEPDLEQPFAATPPRIEPERQTKIVPE